MSTEPLYNAICRNILHHAHDRGDRRGRATIIWISFVWGILSGFPLCCVWAYVVDTYKKVDLVAEQRLGEFGLQFQSDLAPRKGYVLCRRCLAKHLKEATCGP